MDFYNTIEQTGSAEFKDRGSKFIGYAFPLTGTAAFKECQAGLKKEHPKAVHYCFAYRIGTDGNNFRRSDDGEPAGTAGKPILGQLDSKGITNALIIVVRYFGGTLLGVPGLINAYKTAASLALQVVPVVQKPVLKNFALQFNYTFINDVLIVLKQHQSVIEKQEIQLFCLIKVGIPVSRLPETLYKLKEIPNVEIIEIL